MTPFATIRLAEATPVTAPDGSSLRPLLTSAGGSMVQFSLAPGQVSGAVSHRTVEEIWYVVSGSGRLWRSQADESHIVELQAGVCVTIPLRTRFQFRNDADTMLSIVAVTMPPWPGDAEAVRENGPWPAD